MSRSLVPSPSTPVVLTANRLRDGLSVWMTPCGWGTDPRAAVLFEDAQAADAALADADAQPGVVVGPYLTQSGRDADGLPVPVHFREAFRQSGPSVETSAPHFSQSHETHEAAHV